MVRCSANVFERRPRVDIIGHRRHLPIVLLHMQIRDRRIQTGFDHSHAGCPSISAARAFATSSVVTRSSPARRASRSAASRRRLAAEMRTSTGCASTTSSSSALASSFQGISSCSRAGVASTWSRSAAERKDVEQRVEQRVADFLHQIGRAGIAHERRAGVAADDRAGKRRRNVDRAAADLRQVHALVVAAEQDQRRLLAHRRAHRVVVRLDAGACARRRRCRAGPSRSSRKFRTPRA